jgi:hypothetical protein
MIPTNMLGSQPQLTEADVRTIVQEEINKENNNG